MTSGVQVSDMERTNLYLVRLAGGGGWRAATAGAAFNAPCLTIFRLEMLTNGGCTRLETVGTGTEAASFTAGPLATTDGLRTRHVLTLLMILAGGGGGVASRFIVGSSR